MADRFHAGISSGNNWWNTGRPTSSFDAPAMSAAASFSCATDLITNAGGFNWAAEAGGPIYMFEDKSRPCDESPGSNSSVTYQDVQTFSRPQASVASPAPMLDVATPSLMDLGLSSPTFNWNQSFFSSKTSGRADQINSFQALFQEDVESQMQTIMETSALSSAVSKGMNQSFPHDEHPVIASSADNLPLLPSSLLQGIFAPEETRLKRSFYANQSPNFTSPVTCYERFDDQVTVPTVQVKPPQQKTSQLKQQMQFSDFASEACSGYYESAPTPVQNESSGHSNLTGKPNARPRSSNAASQKTTCSEPVQKKARVETPSPLPTFKVRKEKLGDRITALQQLVSPFGKTDTASVLHEAIDYIKFLHDQVRALSVPYLKNGHQVQQVKGFDKSKDCEGRNQDLQSRGLCLVPISSTFVVASETPIDFWTPMLGGAYR